MSPSSSRIAARGSFSCFIATLGIQLPLRYFGLNFTAVTVGHALQSADFSDFFSIFSIVLHRAPVTQNAIQTLDFLANHLFQFELEPDVVGLDRPNSRKEPSIAIAR